MNNVAMTEFRFQNRGNSLSALKWIPFAPSRGAVVFVHGLGDHAGRYAEVAQFLNNNGYAVYCLNFEGHGHSPGPRAHIPQFEHLVEDLAAFVDVVHEEQKNIPVFLVGYSMGGAVVASYVTAKEHRLAGVIFSAGALTGNKAIPAILKKLVGMLASVLPMLRVIPLAKGTQMTRHPSMVDDYETDPLMACDKMTIITAVQLVAAVDRVEQQLNRVLVPFLVMQGTADTLTLPEGASALYEVSPSSDKSIELYDGALHDLLHEINREAVFEDIRAWLDARTQMA